MTGAKTGALWGLLGILMAGCGGGSEAVVVHGATIFDGTGSPALENAEMVIVDGRIRCIGETGDCARPGSFDDVAAAGFWIVPGLIDTHMHAFFGSNPDQAWRDERLRFLLGVTTTRDGSTRRNHAANIEAAARSSDAELPVPRLYVAGRVGPAAATDARAAAAAVRGLAESGAASIKVKDAYPLAVLEAIRSSARELGLSVWGHAFEDGTVRRLRLEALPAGYDGVAHLIGVAAHAVPDSVLAAPPGELGDPAWKIWDRSLWGRADTARLDGLARDLAAMVWLEPLLVVEEQWSEPYGLPPGLHRLAELPAVVTGIATPEGIPERSESDFERLRESAEVMRRFVRTFHEAGGVVVTGTDGALAPGLSLQEEIKALVRAGFSNEAALMAATSAAAEVIGASDSLGTLEPGKLADFVVLEGDPLADIRNIELVSRVAKGGVLHDPSTLFDQLKDDVGASSTPPSRRVLIGLVAVAIVVTLTVVAIVRHSRRGKGRV
ncbi:MAG: amidohydrolase family protein [Gemmatimonadota bacterium]|nr:amidohydrolase family protein [Gemmatimonadota bacterium]